MSLRRERFIRKVLRQLARQRVAAILQPGDIWVIEFAVGDSGGVSEALRTCHLRGWIEPIQHAVPREALTQDGKLPEGHLFTGQTTIYRLTEAGWAAINRTHAWIMATFAVAATSLAATILSVVFTCTTVSN